MSFCAQILFALAAWWRRLHYPFLHAWLWASTVRTIALRAVGMRHEQAYLNLYMFTDPLLMALLAAVVLEVFQQRSKGLVLIGRAGNILFAILVLVAAGITAVTFLSGDQAPRAAAIASLVAFRRTGLTLLFGFLVVAFLFFQMYPAPGKPNLRTHHALLTIYFTGPLAAMIGIWFDPLRTAVYNVGALAASAGSYLAWTLLMKAEGETDPETPSPGRAAALEREAGEMVRHLQAAAKQARRPGPPTS
ncbi:MAG: hypothetical protein R2729_05675 [Bryobacteraceae bacterium]